MKRAMVCSAALAAFLSAPVVAQESLERAMLKQAPQLIQHFKEHGYKNVGVLKFLVNREGQQKFSDKAGTLNLLLARRLELALILANDPKTPIGIIEDASAIAQKTPGANHLSKEGRLKLFEPSYPLAWGTDKVRANAFVTGTANIGADLKTLTISLIIFDRQTNRLTPLFDDFVAANRAEHLSEMGESFVLRGAFDDGKTEPSAAANKQQQTILHEAARVHAKEAPHPAKVTDVPVVLEVRYDGRPIPYEVRDGQAFIPEPNEGQKVELVMRRDGSKERYGVVLKVNGENTIDKQRQPDLACRKWVLDPGFPAATISGYLLGTDVIEKFRVLSAYESKEREINYGADVGTITMTVFREIKGKEAGGDLSDEAAKETVVAKLPALKERSKNYHALKASLLDDANRGLIGEGDKVKTQVNVVPFRPDPRPVMCLTVVYYKR
jgi:hypothetical protein